jgi:hypothetical protein
MEIGGFFEVESSADSGIGPEGSVDLASGRSALSLFIQVEKPSLVHLPAYICNEVVEHFLELGVQVKYFNLNADFLPLNWPDVLEEEWILGVNYFGLCGMKLQLFYDRYGSKLLVDNVQGWFENRFHDCWSFNSARKFFGVPDGNRTFVPPHVVLSDSIVPNPFISMDHLYLRKIGKTALGYQAYKDYEKKITKTVARMSIISKDLLARIDMKSAAQRRRDNFEFLHKQLGSSNLLDVKILNDLGSNVPFCYPYMPNQKIHKEKLARDGIFVPTFWADSDIRFVSGSFESELVDKLLPLPVDQRYNLEAMKSIIAKIGK